MAEKWTVNRRKVARFLERYIETKGRAPSLDEIAEGTGLWKRSVEIVLKGLEKMGVIEITPGISRGVRLVPKPALRIPMLGEVQAGTPAMTQESPTEYLNLDRKLVPFKNPVALRVSGFSMQDAGILPGDVVLLKEQTTAQSGETVVAWLNGGLTVKTFSSKGRRVQLIPANPAYKAAVIGPEDEFFIVGKVMLVLRDLGRCFEFSAESATFD